MKAILDIPLEVRLGCLFLLGIVAAAGVNLAVYRLAWRQRSISPWSAPPAGVAPRRWHDLIPILGWWFLRRESARHGRGFWIRPLAVELATGLAFAGLYYWEIEASVPHWPTVGGVMAPVALLSSNVALVLHLGYVSHLILIALMLVASLIDVDEQSIPDAVTINGTLVGLILAAVYPWSLLPAADWLVDGKRAVEFLTLAAPNPWPDDLGGWPLVAPLAAALACWTLWCAALLPRRWNVRRGLGTAMRVFFHRLRGESITYLISAMWLAGLAAIGLAAWGAPQANWAGLLTALVGMAAGGLVIWSVRIIGGAALGREAMGFGDVTLMAMIGAYVGWQPVFIIFFLAPFFAVVVGVAQWIFRGEHEVPYGPFLCLATLGLIVRWDELWDATNVYFQMGWILIALLGGCMAMMGLMLSAYQMTRNRLAKGR